MSSLEERVKIFEDTLADFANEYSANRLGSAFCSEADVRVHLAHKLLGKLPTSDVHAELPIPLDVKQFRGELWGKGRISSYKCVKADIAIIDNRNFCPQIITELKYTPIYWSINPLLIIPKSKDEENKNKLREWLRKSLDYLQRCRLEKPNLKEIENAYFGPHKNNPTTVEKMIQIVNRFKTDEQTDIRAYLCVFDEIYPNIQEILDEAIDHYEPPDTFNIIAFHIPISDILEDTFKELTSSIN